MNRHLAALILQSAVVLIAPRGVKAEPITIPTVFVGNPGNANDLADGDDDTPGVQSFGAVARSYRIGTTEVTNEHYAAFLNAKAAIDPLNLYSKSMGSDPRGGITRSGVSGSYTYTPRTNMGNKPVNFVNWYDSIRFANWLHNGQGSGNTEFGAYLLLGGTPTPTNSASITRSPSAVWWLPSENEWYKAAYYDPTLDGGTGDYWDYSTKSDSAPAIATANAVGDINPGTVLANYKLGAKWNGQVGNVTTVGSAGKLSESYYGTSDQGGNVWEWNESSVGGGYSHYLRGGSLYDQPLDLNSTQRLPYPSSEDDHTFGFRVATVPEPSTFVLAICGSMGLLIATRGHSRRSSVHVSTR